MRSVRRTSMEPAPTPEEAAAIMAALSVLGGADARAQAPIRGRWRLAGLLGHPVPPGTKLEGSLWSRPGWGGGL